MILTSRKAKFYTFLIMAIGFVLSIYVFYTYIINVNPANLALEIQQMICLTILCVLCPFIANLCWRRAAGIGCIGCEYTGCVITKGPYAAMCVYLISSLFTVDYDKETKDLSPFI